MAITLEQVNRELKEIKQGVNFLIERFDDEKELTDSAKKELERSRKRNKYIPHKEVMERYGR